MDLYLCWLVEIARTGELVEIQVHDLCWLVEVGGLAEIQVHNLCWLVETGELVEIQVQDLCWLVEVGGLAEIQVHNLCWLVEIGGLVEIQVQDLCWLVETGELVEIQVQDLCWLNIARIGELVQIHVQDLCWLNIARIGELVQIHVQDLCWLVEIVRTGSRGLIEISQSQDPFFCPQCRLDIQSRELSTLKAAIATLNEELTAVKNQLSNSQPSPSTTTPLSSSTTSNQADSKAASEVPRDIPLQTQHTQQQGTYPQVQYSRQPDKKFNVVIYGIEECPKGTPKHERFNRDLENIMTVISSVDTDSSIQPQSIRDHFRLGKFKNSS